MKSAESLERARSDFGLLGHPWRAIAAGFLVEKAHRSGSRRTVEVYGRTLARFLAGIADPSEATPLDVYAFAYGQGPAALIPSASTVLVRLAAVSGFFDFACRMELLSSNPAAKVRRPQAHHPLPRGLTTAEVTRLLSVIPETPMGLLDRAMIVTALLTGLRRSELVDLQVVAPQASGPPRYEVCTKGGVTRRRQLAEPAWQAILAAAAAIGRDVVDAVARPFPISDATFYAHLRQHSEAAGLGRVTPHCLRHTAARLRRDAGATIEAVSSLLGHRSIATTAIYLRRLEDERDDDWQDVAEALGLAKRRLVQVARDQE